MTRRGMGEEEESESGRIWGGRDEGLRWESLFYLYNCILFSGNHLMRLIRSKLMVILTLSYFKKYKKYTKMGAKSHIRM